MSLLQRTRLASNSETTSESPDTTLSSPAISPNTSTQTTDAPSDSAPKLPNDEHTETGLGEGYSMDCGYDAMKRDTLHAKSIQQRNPGTDLDFHMGSIIDGALSSPDGQVTLGRGFGSESEGTYPHCSVYRNF